MRGGVRRMADLTLDDADPQDLADVICGLTAIGGYSAQAGLDDDAARIGLLRRRLVIENEDLARDLLASDYVTTGADPAEFEQGIRDILEEVNDDA